MLLEASLLFAAEVCKGILWMLAEFFTH